MLCGRSQLCTRVAVRAVRLPHTLSAGGPFRPDAAAGSLLPAERATQAHQLSSLAVDMHAAPPPLAPFPSRTAPAPSAPRRPDTYLQEGVREAPMLQAIRAQVAEGETNAFNMYDLQIVADQLHRFRRELPRVQPFYAMKCNPDERVVGLLAAHGANFDCASKAEIEVACRNGATPDRIIFANPIKQPSHVAFAAAAGVNITTFDGADELFKIHALQPNARLVYRVRVDDSHAVCTMSQKYGAPLSNLPELLTLATSLNLNVVGVSYHVGARARARTLPSAPRTRAAAPWPAARARLPGPHRGSPPSLATLAAQGAGRCPRSPSPTRCALRAPPSTWPRSTGTS